MKILYQGHIWFKINCTFKVLGFKISRVLTIYIERSEILHRKLNGSNYHSIGTLCKLWTNDCGDTFFYSFQYSQ